MSSSRLTILGVVLGLAGAALLALFLVSGSGQSSGDQVSVLVAADGGVPLGTTADALGELLESREVPADVAPARAVADLAELTGQRVARPIGPGEIITIDQFGQPGPATGGVIVEEGWEAITVSAAPAPGLQGYATPGSLVNLYLTATEPDLVSATGTTAPDGSQVISPDGQVTQDGRPFTQLVMAHTEVLAVTPGTLTGEAQQTEGGPSGVFLLKVRAQDVPTLVFAEQQGEIWFTLANENDPVPTAERFFFDGLDPAAIQAALGEARAALDAGRDEADAAVTEATATEGGS